MMTTTTTQTLRAEYDRLVESRDLRFFHPETAMSEQERRTQGEQDALTPPEQGERVRALFRMAADTMDEMAFLQTLPGLRRCPPVAS